MSFLLEPDTLPDLKKKSTHKLNKQKISQKISKEESYLNLSRTKQEILNNKYYRGIICRFTGKDFEERDKLTVKDIEEAILLKELIKNLSKTLEISVLPIAKKNYKWEDKQSKRLRGIYMKKARELAEILNNISLDNISNAEEIYLRSCEIHEKTTSYLNLSNAVALIDKGPKRKRKTKVSLSTLFKEIYINGERACLFGMFEGFSEKGKEFLPSTIAIDLLKQNSETINTKNIPSWLDWFAHIADYEIRKQIDGFSGSSAIYGIVINKKMYYVNLGNNAIYKININNEIIKVHEPVPEMINDRDKLLSSLKYPYYFLGAFSQKIKMKNGSKIIQNPFKLKKPHINVHELTGNELILIVNSGVWKGNIELKPNGIRIGNNIESIIKKGKNIISIAERINLHTKKKMKESKNKFLEGDIGVLLFQI